MRLTIPDPTLSEAGRTLAEAVRAAGGELSWSVARCATLASLGR